MRQKDAYHHRAGFALRFLVLFACLLPQAAHAFDLEERLPFSAFSGVNMDRIVKGQIEGTRPSVKGVMAVETLTFIPLSPEKVARGLLTWNPQEHREQLDIVSHTSIPKPPSQEAFRSLALLKSDRAQADLIRLSSLAETPSKSNLFIARADVSKLAQASSPTACSSAWRDILYDRASIYQEKGLPALPPTLTSGKPFHTATSFKYLFVKLPEIRRNFVPLIQTLWTGKPSGSIESHHYWEQLNVSGTTTLNLGTTLARPDRDRAWQLADLQYYVTSSYFASVVLYQIEPVTHEGESGSLIWRADYVLTPSYFGMPAVERMFAEKILLQEVKEFLELFRSDITK